MKISNVFRLLALCGWLAVPYAAASAQVDTLSPKPGLIRQADLLPIAGSIALVGAAFAADRSIQRSFQSEATQTNSFFMHTSDAAGVVADPGVLVFSAATYFAGLATHSRPVAALGMYTGEAVVLGGVVAEVFKGAAGRSRPKVDSLAVHSFHAGKGFSNDDFGSFPSAETTIAFAAATASSRYVSREWPHAAHIVTPAAYTLATLAGLSRLYKNEHWASDVVAGAVLGAAAAVEFDRWNLAHPNNVWERIFLPKSFQVRGHYRSIGWSL